MFRLKPNFALLCMCTSVAFSQQVASQACIVLSHCAASLQLSPRSDSIALHRHMSETSPARFRQCRLEDFCFRFQSRRTCARHGAAAVLLESSSDIEEIELAPQAQTPPARMADSVSGIQACSALADWTSLFWQHLYPQERMAWQACSFFLRSDLRWHGKHLPMWNQDQLHALEHASHAEPAESEGTASFSTDHSIADSEIDAVYQTLPRRAG